MVMSLVSTGGHSLASGPLLNFRTTPPPRRRPSLPYLKTPRAAIVESRPVRVAPATRDNGNGGLVLVSAGAAGGGGGGGGGSRAEDMQAEARAMARAVDARAEANVYAYRRPHGVRWRFASDLVAGN
ncbi:unnamed protein product [Linum trigynum]|uniref:Uncharacterized protein n=1 Tax=Linum trigynum TaxID=586398 RepID=A0AAV2F805_9ROSI